MIVAVENWIEDGLGAKLNDELILTGYSQGGHTAMALHRLIEQETDRAITLAMPMSGPYSISSGVRDILISNEEYSVVSYVAYVALSYQEVYGNIFPNNDINQFFNPEYVSYINQFANEELALFELDTLLRDELIDQVGGAFPSAMIQDQIIEEILNNEDHPVNVALRDNDVFDWAPQADTRILYCLGDDQVAFTNALIARDTMLANGAPMVTATNLADDFDHGECVQPSATILVFYLLASSGPTSVADESNISFSIFPNPSNGGTTVGGNFEEEIAIDVFNIDGQLVSQFSNCLLYTSPSPRD